MTKMELDDSTKAYFEGMLWAAYGVKLMGGFISEWQIDAIKECASRLKLAEIDHFQLSPCEKDELKRLWKQRFDALTSGIKNKLKQEGRIVGGYLV
ncbi:MAG: hypothetical protein IK103_09030 [Bacteroidales bacterium]|nr:hypothetical protein [Bacteroidales bacterium]